MSLSTLLTKLRAARRRGGPAEVRRVVAGAIAERLSPRRRRAARERQRREAEFDRERGVDTSGLISPLDVGPVVGPREDGHRYQGSDPGPLRRTIESLGLNFPDYTFLDLGSGKGRALLIAAEYPFRAVVGFEHAVRMHEIATRNIATDRGPRRCRDVRSVLADASACPTPDGGLVVHMYNPFGPAVVARVLENLGASWRGHPRDMYIIYSSPLEVCPPAMFAAHGFAPVPVAAEDAVYRAGAGPSPGATTPAGRNP